MRARSRIRECRFTTSSRLLILLLVTVPSLLAAQEPAVPMRVGGDVKPPTKIFAPNPEYNQAAKRAKVTGVVIVAANIDAQGKVGKVEILKGLPMGLGQAALDAVKRWKFKPATLNGRPTAVLHTLTFHFQPGSRAFKVIVNSDVSNTALSASELSRIFMKKITSWESGLEIKPVNLAVHHPTREAFSREIHGKGPEPVERHWDKLIFSGAAVPPVRLETESEVIEFVRRNTGGVGYVGIDTALPREVTTLEIK